MDRRNASQHLSLGYSVVLAMAMTLAVYAAVFVVCLWCNWKWGIPISLGYISLVAIDARKSKVGFVTVADVRRAWAGLGLTALRLENVLRPLVSDGVNSSMPDSMQILQPKSSRVHASCATQCVWYALLVCAIPLPGIAYIFGRDSPVCSDTVPHQCMFQRPPISKWRTDWSQLPAAIVDEWQGNEDSYVGHGKRHPKHVTVGGTFYFLEDSSKSLLNLPANKNSPVRVDLNQQDSSASFPMIDWIVAPSGSILCAGSVQRNIMTVGTFNSAYSAKFSRWKRASTIFCRSNDSGFKDVEANWSSEDLQDRILLDKGLLWFFVYGYASNELEGLNMGYAVLSLNPATMKFELHSTRSKWGDDVLPKMVLDLGYDGSKGFWAAFLLSIVPLFVVSAFFWIKTDIKSILLGPFLGATLWLIFLDTGSREAVLPFCWSCTVIISIFLNMTADVETRKMLLWGTSACATSIPVTAGLQLMFESTESLGTVMLNCAALALVGLGIDFAPIFLLGVASTTVSVVASTFLIFAQYASTSGLHTSIFCLALLCELLLVLFGSSILYSFRSRIRLLALYWLREWSIAERVLVSGGQSPHGSSPKPIGVV